MLLRRRSWLVYLSGLFLGTTGCQSPTMVSNWFARKPAPAAAANGSVAPTGQAHGYLAPGMEVQWRVQTTQDQPGQVKSGKAQIGPDGTMVVGPYGMCRVAGLTLDQASLALQRHLAPYIKAARVQLNATGAYTS